MFAEGSVDALYIEVKLCEDRSRKGNDELTAFLEVQTCDNVTEVKEKILAEMSLGLLTDNYKLFYNDVMLADDAYLIDYNVQDFDSLTMKCYSTGHIAGLTQHSLKDTGTKSVGSNSEGGGGGSLAGGGEAARRVDARSGRRGLYENATTLPSTPNSDKNSQGNEFDPSLHLVSMFKDMVQHVSSVGLCCLRSGDVDEDSYDDHRGGVDAF